MKKKTEIIRCKILRVSKEKHWISYPNGAEKEEEVVIVDFENEYGAWDDRVAYPLEAYDILKKLEGKTVRMEDTTTTIGKRGQEHHDYRIKGVIRRFNPIRKDSSEWIALKS